MDAELKIVFKSLQGEIKEVKDLLKNHLKHHWEFTIALIAITGGLVSTLIIVLAP